MFRTLTAAAALTALAGAAYAENHTEETEAEEVEVQTEADTDAETGTEMEAASDNEAEVETDTEVEAEAEAETETETTTVEIQPAEEETEAADTETETVEVEQVETEDAATEAAVVVVEDTETEMSAQGAPFAQVTLDYGSNYLASTLIGQRVHAVDADVTPGQVFPAGTAADWDDIGEIGDLVIGVDGSLEAVVVDVGGFLGLGEREVAIRWDALVPVREDDSEEEYFLGINIPEDAMENAPELDRAPVTE